MKSGFDISFTDDFFTDGGTTFRQLRLTLGDFSEEMDADLTNWSAEDYENQWLFELRQITTTRNKGALITSINDPRYAYRIWSWPMWKQNDVVVFQNRFLFMLAPNFDFRPAHIHEDIGEYRAVNEDGTPLSQWEVPLSFIRDFVTERLNA